MEEFIRDAIELTQRAINFDQQNNFQVAVYFYNEAIGIWDRAIDLGQGQPGSERSLEQIQAKVTEYRSRIETLEKVLNDEAEKVPIVPEESQEDQSALEYNRVSFMVIEALTEDESGNDKEAIELYSQAVETCLELKAKVEGEDRSPEEIADFKRKITQLASQALGRAEILKARLKMESCSTSPEPANYSQPPPVRLGLATKTNVGGTGTGYTDEEKAVLLRNSTINRIEYVPFLSVDLKERFAYPLPYSDPNGFLKLSPKQKARFKRWARPTEIWGQNARIVREGGIPDPFSIKQTIVSDCSFVASLAIAALYEKRFLTKDGKRQKLVTSIIYPQDRNGDPVFNPVGKYMVKLHLNGVYRKIIIDDFLPIGDHGELLCSYSKHKQGELWVSLLEKAYMKVMGGYDFPGSNSNIDLHSLIGWIPERVSISNGEFDKDATFRKLYERLPKGDVLVTVATGEMNDAEADRAGLVSTHAYAVLEIKEVKGIRLFLLKNPWSHLRWKGNYSELDTHHWTPEMKSLLNYDPASAANFDDGIFWIDYDSICRFFDVFYMSWNPNLFSFTYGTHRSWHANLGPAKDLYSIGDNPQYSLEAKLPPGSSGGAIWVLLTRHITDIEDFRENREYITLLVYDHKQGHKVFYPYDPPPLIDGVRINSPHYLCKITFNQPKNFTLVVSQYEKTKAIHYTLKAYSTCPFKLTELVDPYKCHKRVTGEWKGRSAGGCANNPATYGFNPSFDVVMQSPGAKIQIEMRGPKGFHVGFDLIEKSNGGPEVGQHRFKVSSGPYRPGYVVIQADLPTGAGTNFKLIPSTFNPGLEGPFILDFKATCVFSIK